MPAKHCISASRRSAARSARSSRASTRRSSIVMPAVSFSPSKARCSTATVREIFGRLSEAEALIAESKAKPQGALRVTTTVGLGSMWLTPRIREFLEIYPEIAMTLAGRRCRGRPQSSPCRHRHPHGGAKAQPDLIQRRLMTGKFSRLCRAQLPQAHTGIPKSAGELDNHGIIVYLRRSATALPEYRTGCSPKALPEGKNARAGIPSQQRLRHLPRGRRVDWAWPRCPTT